MTTLRFIGLDVHAETIVIAVADAGSTPAVNLKVIGNDEGRLLAELRKLGTLESLRVCYEAGPTGFPAPYPTPSCGNSVASRRTRR